MWLVWPATRRFAYEAMGDRSMDEGAQPDDRELEHIAQMVKQSVEEGAVGFRPRVFTAYRSRRQMHTRHLGRPEETKAIQRAIVAGGGHGAVFQSANDMQTRFETELEMFRDATDLGCQVLFSGALVHKATVAWRAGEAFLKSKIPAANVWRAYAIPARAAPSLAWLNSRRSPKSPQLGVN